MPVFISENSNKSLIDFFSDVVLIHSSDAVYKAISSHPDIFYCKLPDGDVFASESGELGKSYPYNIGVNAVCLDRYFIHNTRYTNKRLRNYIDSLSLEIIHVRQGYTKCSCVVVDGNSIITSDAGIYKTVSLYSDIDVLKISEGNVTLPGFEHGFLGGASGKVGNTLYFSGDITKHPDFIRIYDFVTAKNVDIKWFDYPLEDIGSIIEFNNII